MIKRNEKLGPRFLQEAHDPLIERLLRLEQETGTKGIVEIRITGDVVIPYEIITEADKHGSLVAAAAQETEPGEYHESDATGVIDDELEFVEDDPLKALRAAKRHSDNVGDGGLFNGA